MEDTGGQHPHLLRTSPEALPSSILKCLANIFGSLIVSASQRSLLDSRFPSA